MNYDGSSLIEIGGAFPTFHPSTGDHHWYYKYQVANSVDKTNLEPNVSISSHVLGVIMYLFFLWTGFLWFKQTSNMILAFPEPTCTPTRKAAQDALVPVQWITSQRLAHDTNKHGSICYVPVSLAVSLTGFILLPMITSNFSGVWFWYHTHRQTSNNCRWKSGRQFGDPSPWCCPWTFFDSSVRGDPTQSAFHACRDAWSLGRATCSPWGCRSWEEGKVERPKKHMMCSQDLYL